MDSRVLVFILFYVLSQTECGLMNGDRDGNKDSVVILVEPDTNKFVLKSKETRGDNWELQGNWKSKKDYSIELVGQTTHTNYILNCYKPKASGNSRIAMFFGYNELFEAEVAQCDEAKVWNSIRILEPKQGYHHISVLFKNTCKEYQVNVETSKDSTSTACQRNAGAADWQKIG